MVPTLHAYAAILLFRASRPFVRGLIWLTLGLIFNTANRIFGLVGFIGTLVYLFEVINVIKPLSVPEGEIEEKIRDIQKKLQELDNT